MSTGQDEKAMRLAVALRANLQHRKRRAREIASETAPPACEDVPPLDRR